MSQTHDPRRTSFYRVNVESLEEEPTNSNIQFTEYQPQGSVLASSSAAPAGAFRRAASRRVAFDRGGVSYLSENEYKYISSMHDRAGESMTSSEVQFQNQDGFKFQKSNRVESHQPRNVETRTSTTIRAANFNAPMVTGDFLAQETNHMQHHVQQQQHSQQQQQPPVMPVPYVFPMPHPGMYNPYGMVPGGQYLGPYAAVPHPMLPHSALQGIQPHLNQSQQNGYFHPQQGSVRPNPHIRPNQDHSRSEIDALQIGSQQVSHQLQQQPRAQKKETKTSRAQLSPYRVRPPGRLTQEGGKPRYEPQQDEEYDQDDKEEAGSNHFMSEQSRRDGAHLNRTNSQRSEKLTEELKPSKPKDPKQQKAQGLAAMKIRYPSVTHPFSLRTGMRMPIPLGPEHLYKKTRKCEKELNESLNLDSILSIPQILLEDQAPEKVAEEYCLLGACLTGANFDESVKRYAETLGDAHVQEAERTFTKENGADFIADGINEVVRMFIERVKSPTESFAPLIRGAVSISVDPTNDHEVIGSNSDPSEIDPSLSHGILGIEDELEEDTLALRSVGLSRRKPASTIEADLDLITKASSGNAGEEVKVQNNEIKRTKTPGITLGQFSMPQLDFPSVKIPMPKTLVPSQLVLRTVPLMIAPEVQQKRQLAFAYEQLLKDIEQEISEWRHVQQIVDERNDSSNKVSESASESALQSVTAPAYRTQRRSLAEPGTEDESHETKCTTRVCELVERVRNGQVNKQKRENESDEKIKGGEAELPLADELMDTFVEVYGAVSVTDGHALSLLRAIRRVLAESDSYRKTLSRCLSAATQPPVSSSEVQSIISTMLTGGNSLNGKNLGNPPPRP